MHQQRMGEHLLLQLLGQLLSSSIDWQGVKWALGSFVRAVVKDPPDGATSSLLQRPTVPLLLAAAGASCCGIVPQHAGSVRLAKL